MVEEKLLQIFSPAYSDITNLFISKYKVKMVCKIISTSTKK